MRSCSGGYGSEMVRVCGGLTASRDASTVSCRLIVRVGVREVLDHELDRLERPLQAERRGSRGLRDQHRIGYGSRRSGGRERIVHRPSTAASPRLVRRIVLRRRSHRRVRLVSVDVSIGRLLLSMILGRSSVRVVQFLILYRVVREGRLGPIPRLGRVLRLVVVVARERCGVRSVVDVASGRSSLPPTPAVHEAQNEETEHADRRNGDESECHVAQVHDVVRHAVHVVSDLDHFRDAIAEQRVHVHEVGLVIIVAHVLVGGMGGGGSHLLKSRPS
ncbi:hypothetical protein PFISCL1PPCAC_23107 [Pristionchus fissidentatus]|uniref:G protein-coupled receptor n=1 Tax=Pristionchus fissidentatus TaxID=1538716 RepID=A0AAV5WMI2_9BILA|nr:hypothetical protein PFISCL1PPCAC_23107 [Pristionchus fissidentatus]